jgi:bifunctional enzyme CysN/CysC
MRALKKMAMQAEPSGATAVVELVNPMLNTQVRVLTCGSVDDGKSTLIGRLLWDASDLFEDQRETLRKSPRRVLDGTHLDYSLLVDGLLAEREQGITIDIAWRYFDSADRRFVIIDSPGHQQYTRNMASGASHADVAVLLIDARHGIKAQTKRHMALLDLFGVKRVVLAINKMDLVGHSEARFRELEGELRLLMRRFRFDESAAIPVVAITGENVARSSENMRWYRGATLLDQLNRVRPMAPDAKLAFRMPVQTVLRDGQDFRGLAGTVTAGKIAVGDAVVDSVSGLVARVARIATMTRDLDWAGPGQAIALVLDRDIDVSRGAVLARPEAAPVAARTVEARLVWLSDTPFDPRASYQLRTATDLVPITSLGIAGHLDLETMGETHADGIAANDIASVRISLARATALDPFLAAQRTGSFVLVDPITGATVAGGTVTTVSAFGAERVTEVEGQHFRLTRELLAKGVCAGLGPSSADQAEFRRRAGAVGDLLRAAGVRVEMGEGLA